MACIGSDSICDIRDSLVQAKILIEVLCESHYGSSIPEYVLPHLQDIKDSIASLDSLNVSPSLRAVR